MGDLSVTCALRATVASAVEPQVRGLCAVVVAAAAGSGDRLREIWEIILVLHGIPIGRLIPLRRRIFVPREEVMAVFASAPVLDVERFRADI